MRVASPDSTNPHGLAGGKANGGTAAPRGADGGRRSGSRCLTGRDGSGLAKMQTVVNEMERRRNWAWGKRPYKLAGAAPARMMRGYI